jgi:hypothetical protein
VDGSPAELLRADLVYKAVEVPPGRHEVMFEYRPRFLLVGWLVSGISFLVLVALTVVVPRLRKRNVTIAS